MQDELPCTWFLGPCTLSSGKKASIRLSSPKERSGWLTGERSWVLLAPSLGADQSRRAESYLVADATCTQRMKEFSEKRLTRTGTLKVWEGELTGTGLRSKPTYELYARFHNVLAPTIVDDLGPEKASRD